LKLSKVLLGVCTLKKSLFNVDHYDFSDIFWSHRIPGPTHQISNRRNVLVDWKTKALMLYLFWMVKIAWAKIFKPCALGRNWFSGGEVVNRDRPQLIWNIFF
jgi:hypothetical protein